MMKRVGFIGLGLMGAPMAANVARSGYPLTVYNRTASKAENLLFLGARIANSPREVAEASEVLITMLSDPQAVEAVVFGEDGILSGAREGLVLIDMSTIAPDDSRRIAAKLKEHGVSMLDAPVMGSTGPAADGTLGILVGGDEAVFQVHHDLLGVLGKDIYYLGSQGSGAQMKLSMNLLVAAELAALAEAMVLAAKAGIDLSLAGQIIAESNLSSNLINRKIKNIVNQDYSPAFSLKHMHKDLGLIIRSADALGAALPASSAIHQLYTASKSRGHGDEDFSAVFTLLAEMAGLDE